MTHLQNETSVQSLQERMACIEQEKIKELMGKKLGNEKKEEDKKKQSMY